MYTTVCFGKSMPWHINIISTKTQTVTPDDTTNNKTPDISQIFPKHIVAH